MLDSKTHRIERDSLGSVEVPINALYGIHTVRAVENFPSKSEFSIEWYKSLGLCKKAYYLTFRDFITAAKANNKDISNIVCINNEVLDALISSADDISKGLWFDNFIVPAIQGGAGTSINMNINEILANLSLMKLDRSVGDYQVIDPFESANLYHSTNDIIPSSLKVAAISQFENLENSINKLRSRFEVLETEYGNNLRMAYTQMQEAVPSSYSVLFSGYSDTLSRDWWRVSKCFERLKTLNLGGGAAGTGLSIPRYFIMNVVKNLKSITGLPIARSENLHDTTANVDSFVEVHAILKSHAVNLEKIASDIRLLGSDVANKQLSINPVQQGSSIIPGKVNPVISEYIVSIAHKVYANDMLISSLASQGCLDLNAYIPTIGHALLESISLLIDADNSMAEKLVNSLSVEKNSHDITFSPTIVTVLTPYIGYKKAAQAAEFMKHNSVSIYEANASLSLMNTEELEKLLSYDSLLRAGFTLNDIE